MGEDNMNTEYQGIELTDGQGMRSNELIRAARFVIRKNRMKADLFWINRIFSDLGEEGVMKTALNLGFKPESKRQGRR